MARPGRLVRVSPGDLDRLLDQARTERWSRLVLLGPDRWVGDTAADWPELLWAAERVYQLTTLIPALANRLRGLVDLTSLNLRSNGIGAEGAKAIAASLPGLTSLDLGYNGIGAEGAEAIAASLPGLTSLDLGGNSIGDEGAKAIAASLPGLTSLALGGNGIGAEGAKAIAASLPGLTSLALGNNRIGAEGAKAIAASLPGLTSLNLWNNSIGAEGAKAIAASLPGLTSLDLRDNSIGAEGAKALLDSLSSRPDNGQLRYLNLQENAGLTNLLPVEVLAETDGQAILAAYRRFTNARETETLRSLDELKLLVVGNEAVGKTSLLRYLVNRQPRDPNEKRTPGIVQHERIEIQGWSPRDCRVRLNVWDFGGQEMMRGTHRFFLTERSLYLLVLEDRRQDDHRSVDDWMKIIRNRGRDSPVIVVINKSDNGKQDFRPDEQGLQETYPNIVAFLRTSCDPGDWAAESIRMLRERIVATITADARLKHVSDPIPANWLQVKDQVRALAEKQAVLPQADFAALCRTRPAGTEPITDGNEQRALLRPLHELGTIVAHGLERDSPATRREISLLDPNWLTGAIYRILDRARSVEHEGEFLRAHLPDWLDPTIYPPERHEFILDMMQDPEIGLCFRLPVSGRECYLLPEALPASRRFYGKWPSDSLRFRFRYNYLPPGLIPRMIVESHRNLPSESPRWRTGAVLATRDCQVLIEANLDQRRVDIQVDGPASLCRAALNVVLNDLDTVHALNPEAGPEARVPLPDSPDQDVAYDYLLRLEQRSGADFVFLPEKAERDYTVGELLEGVRRERTAAQSSVPISRDPGQVVGTPHTRQEATQVVILVHGIRTWATWYEPVRRELANAGLEVVATNYGRFDLFRFLLPIPWFRNRAVEEVARDLGDIFHRHHGQRVSVIAHSFGTYVVSRILKDDQRFHFHRVIFCGGIVPRRFRPANYPGRFQQPLLNEVGTHDILPVLAESTSWGYGATGARGLQRPGGFDRYHHGVGHSAFLNGEFCRKYWLPFLQGEAPTPADDRTPPAWWLSLIHAVPVKYVIIVLVAIAAWFRFGLPWG